MQLPPNITFSLIMGELVKISKSPYLSNSTTDLAGIAIMTANSMKYRADIHIEGGMEGKWEIYGILEGEELNFE